MALMSGGHGSIVSALSELFVHSGYASSAADTLFRAMAPRVQQAPSQGRLMNCMTEALVNTAREHRDSRPPGQSHLRLIQWEAIIPSYLAARRAARPGEKGWVKQWLVGNHPHLLTDNRARINFERTVRRRANAHQGFNRRGAKTPGPGGARGACGATVKYSIRKHSYPAGGPGKTMCEELDEELVYMVCGLDPKT